MVTAPVPIEITSSPLDLDGLSYTSLLTNHLLDQGLSPCSSPPYNCVMFLPGGLRLGMMTSCSSSQVRRGRALSPVYSEGQSVHFILYTIPDLSMALVLSLGETSWDLMVFCGLIWVV